jgi:hypothetical protein
VTVKVSLLVFRLMLSALVLAQLAAAPAIAASSTPDESGQRPKKPFTTAPTLQEEAAEVQANVLAASDLRRATILDADRTTTLNVHAAWVGFDNVIGTLTIVPGETDVLRKAMPYVMTQRAQAQCNGAFSSAPVADQESAVVSRLVTTCRIGAAAPVTATYLAAPRKKGGIFVFGIVGMGGETAAKSADASIRDAVFKVLTPE